MNQPATDEEIATLEQHLQPTLVVFATEASIRSLIARIRAERENAIRECISAIVLHPGGEFEDQGLDKAITILDGLLFKAHQEVLK